MAKFLTTTGTSSAIEEIIRKAVSQLVLVTPYLKLNKHIEQRLKDANKRRVNMTIIYGKTELAPNQIACLEQLEYLDVFYCENLHAKCYYNETTMVMSSMNLYEFSEKNNREIGVQFDVHEDQDLFAEACEEIESIISASESMQSSVSKAKLVHPWLNISNFHLPLLEKMLSHEYPNIDFNLTSDFITAQVSEKVKLEIDYRIFFRFSTEEASDSFKKILNDGLIFKERSFSGYKHVSFYIPKDYKPKVNEEWQKKIADYFMEYIRVAIVKISVI
jgi:hypothetical protein